MKRTGWVWPGVAGLVLGLLALGPGLAPGFLLSFDMVFTPGPRFSAMTFGLTGTVPRHVPSDAFGVALAHVLPGDVAQKAVLLGIFVLASVAAASLVPTRRVVPRVAAGAVYAWNPFVAERLLLGHWAFLLGYAALPLVAGAAARAAEPGGGRRLTRALVPAAIGGFAGVAVSALVAGAVVLCRPGRRRGLPKAVAAVVVLSLPWLVTGWLRPSGMPGAPEGVGAFAARADTPFGALGSLFALGGAWNAATVPPGYGVPLLATVWLVVVVASVVAFARTRVDWTAGLAVAAGAGYVLAALGVVAAPLLRGLIGAWPGFAVLRDGQQYVAPLAVVVAVGFGVLADRAADRRLDALGVLAVLLPLVLLPGLAWGAAGRLRPVHYPDAWARAREIVRADPVPGDVLILPWATYREYPWNGGRTSLDALPRYLDRRGVLSDAVIIGRTVVPAEDPRARALDPVVRDGGPLTARLGARGIRYVAFDAETSGNAYYARLGGAQRVLADGDLVLYRLPDPARPREDRAPVALAGTAWAVTLMSVVWSFAASGITLATRSLRHPRGKAP
ncbi:hypothetical protein BTM25_18370 [Actinomadura rubteroloni]|uniref:YfhO family protein n=1 Tax=Actinomadura rubteroloni TaxID=1926885 RepID=A0A2P4UQV8_9ACTN|nr:hypothetical protein [Actinomadura rubteroloni]POM27423.1 hypothetical protein BTM25_18370 [Actinomadura rubteroloni]